jgi:multidrug efflux pump subunit AcrA (membrane-fusion protein)
MKRLAYGLIPLVVLGGLIAFRLTQKRAQFTAQTAQRGARMKAPMAVTVATARIDDVAQTFDSVGDVEAPLSVNIAAKVTGRIDFLQVREGDRVSKGEVLVRINPDQVEAQVRQQQAAVAEAQYRLAQAQLTQNPTDVSVTTQVREQEAGLASAQADYDQVNENYQAQVDSANAAVTNLDAGIRSAQANLANAQAKYNRLAGLYKQGLISAQDLDDAKTAVGVQQAALDAVIAQRSAAQKQAGIVTSKGKADIASAKAKVAQAQAALESARANIAQTPAYQQSLAALRANVAAAEASLKNVEAMRADTVLVAPLDGFVTNRYMDPGSIATTGQPILRVQYMRQVWITIPVPEDVSASIKLGMPAHVSLDTLPDRAFVGKVTQVNPSADPQSRQFSVRVTLDNPDNLIKPGAYARVAIETSRVRAATVVPREAVEQDREGPYVMVVDGSGKAARRNVTLGAQGIQVIAISSGLQPGEKVVTMSAFALKDGQPVSVAGRRAGGRGGAGRGGAGSAQARAWGGKSR